MQQESTEVAKSADATVADQVQDTAAADGEDFLKGVEAADAESFNVCISCD